MFLFMIFRSKIQWKVASKTTWTQLPKPWDAWCNSAGPQYNPTNGPGGWILASWRLLGWILASWRLLGWVLLCQS